MCGEKARLRGARVSMLHVPALRVPLSRGTPREECERWTHWRTYITIITIMKMPRHTDLWPLSRRVYAGPDGCADPDSSLGDAACRPRCRGRRRGHPVCGAARIG